MAWKRDLTIVVGLVVLAGIVQTVAIWRTVVPETDATRFAAAARRIDERGLLPTLREMDEQPLFPVVVWWVRGAMVRGVGEFPGAWALGVQLAAAVPLVLAVVPLYFMIRSMEGRSAAVAGSIFFCVLPTVARLGPDGLSDGLHLFWLVLAMATVVGYWQSGAEPVAANEKPPEDLSCSHRESAPVRRNPLWLLAAGVAIGMALLTRLESIVLLAVVGGGLVAFQFSRPWRQSWRRMIASEAALVLGLSIVLGPYLVLLGATTPRSALRQVLGRGPAHASAAEASDAIARGDRWQMADGRPMAFNTKDPSYSIRRHGFWAIASLFAKELVEAYNYWIGALALWGFWRLRRRPPRAVDRFTQLLFVAFSAAVIGFAVREGYLGDRHLVTLVVLGVGAAGYGVLDLGRWLVDVGPLQRTGGTGRGGLLPATVWPKGVWVVVFLVAAACLVRTCKPLNAHQAGYRAAALRIASETTTPGVVLDTRGLTGLYSGRTTYTYARAREAFADPRLAYVVLEQRELHFDSDRCRTLHCLLQTAARPWGRFPGPVGEGGQRHTVLVYRWHPDRFSRAVR